MRRAQLLGHRPARQRRQGQYRGHRGAVLDEGSPADPVPIEHLAAVIEFAQKVKATEERIIAQVRAGMDPVEAHEKVNYDNMLKAQAG